MADRTASLSALGWPILGALSGFSAVGLVYVAHLVAARTIDPSVIVDLHRRWPAFLLLDTAPLLLAWSGWLLARLARAERDLEAATAALGPWSDGALSAVLLDGALIVDAHGKVVAANVAATDLFGHDDLRGRSIRALIPDHDGPAQDAIDRRTPVPPRIPVGVEWAMTARRADDSALPVRVACGPATSARLIYVIRPATPGWEGAAAPNLADDLRERLVRERDEARLASYRLSAFLAKRIPELSESLDRIDDRFDRAEAAGGDDNARDAARSLREQLDQLADLAKLEAGTLSLLDEPLDVAALLRRLQPRAASLVASNGNALRTYAGSDLPVLWSDEQRIEQILLILIARANELTEDGDIVLSARTDGSTFADVAIAFEVVDTGIGMDETQLSSWFTEDGPIAPELGAGSGAAALGWALCRALVSRMGGSLSAASAPGEGAKVTVLLRAAPERTLRPPDVDAPRPTITPDLAIGTTYDPTTHPTFDPSAEPSAAPPHAHPQKPTSN